jgi:hypothetical protein
MAGGSSPVSQCDCRRVSSQVIPDRSESSHGDAERLSGTLVGNLCFNDGVSLALDQVGALERLAGELKVGVGMLVAAKRAEELREAFPLEVGSVELAGPSAQLESFYRDLLWELDEFVHSKKATAEGAAVVVKRVGKAHGIGAADVVPLPRLNRAERESRREALWLADQ